LIQLKTRKKKKKKEKESLQNEVIMRGDGDSSDDLPPSPPTFTFKHQIYDTPTHDVMKLDQEDTKKGELFPLDLSVARYTRFGSAATPTKVIDRVSEVIQTMGGKTARKDQFRLVAQFGQVSFVTQVFADPSNEKNVIADFRKKKGASVEFRNYYQEIRAQLADIVLQPPTTTTETEATVDVEISS